VVECLPAQGPELKLQTPAIPKKKERDKKKDLTIVKRYCRTKFTLRQILKKNVSQI
jgi:hypothetical protein